MEIDLALDEMETIDLYATETNGLVDVHYDPTSPRAQSGMAVAEAVAGCAVVDGSTLILGGANVRS